METKDYDWEYEPPRPESELVRVPRHSERCTAISKRNGRRCANYKVHGKQVCRMHGAGSFTGLNHPRALEAVKKGGEVLKYGKSAPARLMRMYEEGLENPNIFAHNDEIALLEARIGELLEQSEEGGGSAELWRQAQKYLQEFQRMRYANEDIAEANLAQLAQIIEAGNHEMGTWDQLLKTVEQRRKLTASHHTQLVQASQLIPVAKVLEMLAEIAKVVQMQVQDRHVVQAILNSIQLQLEEPIEGELVD